MEWYNYVFIVFGALGLFGSLVIIITHFLLPQQMRSPSRQLLVFLSISDLIQGLFFAVYMGPLLQNPSICLAHHIFGIFSASSSFLWTASIALYACAALGDPLCAPPIWILSMFAWGYPLLSILPYFGYYEPQYGWPQEDGKLGWFPCMSTSNQVLMAEYIFPLVAAWLFTLICCLRARNLLQQRHIGSSPLWMQKLGNLRKRLLLVPLLWMLLRIWGLAHLLLTLYTSVAVPNWLVCLRAIGDPSQGFFNAVVYVFFSPRVRFLVLERLGCVSKPSSTFVIPSSAVNGYTRQTIPLFSTQATGYGTYLRPNENEDEESSSTFSSSSSANREYA